MELELVLDKMQEGDSDRVVEIITQAMNEEEGLWARKSFDFHGFCKEHGKEKEDGRTYYVARADGKTVGVTGFYLNMWGPDNVAWLCFFAVEPHSQRKGIGHFMMERTCELAKEAGIRKMFIETYSNDDFVKGRNFYEKFGFKRDGRIKDYLGEGVDMVVYGRDL